MITSKILVENHGEQSQQTELEGREETGILVCLFCLTGTSGEV